MAKNLVIFSDGTGQEGGVGPATNVYKLFKAAENRTARQISFYDRGLGTGFQRFSGSLGGAGISKNILDCYQFLFENFSAGDQIYLFGFSRGAATVRSLSSFIEAFGILPKSRKGLIKEAYDIYMISDRSQRENATIDFHKRHHTMWTKVKFLGVWDTVAALGVPYPGIDRIIDRVPFLKHKFHDFRVSPGVEFAYHALSIDEKRKTFLPTLFDEDVCDGQLLEQMWFAGVHTDIGGGYVDNSLSNIALNWMVTHACDQGLCLHNNNVLTGNGDALGKLHDSCTGLSKFLSTTTRFWPKYDKNGNLRGNPNIHPSVRDRANDNSGRLEEAYVPWIL